jgi:hypothetical protein
VGTLVAAALNPLRSAAHQCADDSS